LVGKEFTYQAALEGYRDILASLNLKQWIIHEPQR
jgi:hypothetical protein